MGQILKQLQFSNLLKQSSGFQSHHNITTCSYTQALYKRKRFPYSQGTSVSSLKLLSTWEDSSCWCQLLHLLLSWTFLLNPPCLRHLLSSFLSRHTRYKLKAFTFLLGQWMGMAWTCFQWPSFFRTTMREWRTTKNSFWTPLMSTPSSWRGWTAKWTWSFF